MKKIVLLAFILALFGSCQNQNQREVVLGGGILSDLMKPIDGQSARSTSTRVDEVTGKPLNHNADNYRVMSGDTKVVLDVKGPGVVTHMWFTFLDKYRHPWAVNGSATHQEMLLRVFYDDSATPDIEVPFGDFFANCFGERREVISMPIVVEDADSYNSFWPMPFQKSIRIEVVNQSETKNVNLLYYNIDWVKKPSLPMNTPYFYAFYRQEYPQNADDGGDYLIMETQGKGHYVGTVFSVRTRSPQWFGEGDEKIYIDGEAEPSIWGTGTEDYFLSAWGLKSGVTTPFFGTVFFDHGMLGGRTSAYRWHIPDPIVFEKSIRVTIEHGGWISADETRERRTHSWEVREDDVSTIAFWYQTGKPAYKGPIPTASERILPSIDKKFPAAVALETGGCKGGNGFLQTNLDHYMDGQLTFKPNTATASVDIPFTVDKKEPHRLLLSLTKAPDFGIWQIFLNGVALRRPVDLYSEQIEPYEHHLLDFWPEPGQYTLTLKLVGKNRFSAGDGLGVEAVKLRERRPRVVGYAFDVDNDWKKEPKFYD